MSISGSICLADHRRVFARFSFSLRLFYYELRNTSLDFPYNRFSHDDTE